MLSVYANIYMFYNRVAKMEMPLEAALESGEPKSALQLSKLYYLKRGKITWQRRRRRRLGMKSWAFAFAETRFYYEPGLFPVTSCLFARIVAIRERVFVKSTICDDSRSLRREYYVRVKRKRTLTARNYIKLWRHLVDYVNRKH